MDDQKEERVTSNKKFQNLIDHLSKCKIEFASQKDECKRLNDLNKKLENELKEARELEKSHRYHLITSREMIANLQETVSQLVYLKRDVQKLKAELVSKNSLISSFEKDKVNVNQKHNDVIAEIRRANELRIEELIKNNDQRVQQVQVDTDTQIAQMTCLVEELRSRIKDMETDHRDKMNLVVLEYEEKIQRSASQVAQLQEQLSHQAARTDANIDAYRRKLEDLEEKLKQSQFKEYLAQSTSSQFESKVERPYSVEPDTYPSSSYAELNTGREYPKVNLPQSNNSKQNTLQVMYREGRPKSADKKGNFNITKKRKLYSDKDYLNL